MKLNVERITHYRELCDDGDHCSGNLGIQFDDVLLLFWNFFQFSTEIRVFISFSLLVDCFFHFRFCLIPHKCVVGPFNKPSTDSLALSLSFSFGTWKLRNLETLNNVNKYEMYMDRQHWQLAMANHYIIIQCFKNGFFQREEQMDETRQKNKWNSFFFSIFEIKYGNGHCLSKHERDSSFITTIRHSHQLNVKHYLWVGCWLCS